MNRLPTTRQLQLLRAISAHHKTKGFPISIRELATVVGIKSTNGVNDHLKALERKGLVSREDRRSRTLQLTKAGHREIA